MLIKIRRDTLIILLLAFILIFSGRLITYIAYASSPEVEQGVPIAGILVRGNDVVPIESIKANVASSGLRSGSYINGDLLVTSKRTLSLEEAIADAKVYAESTTVPGTSAQPIAAADIKVDKNTGIVTVTVVEDFSTAVIGINKNNTKNRR